MKTLRGQLISWFVGLITIIGISGGLGAGLVSLNEQNALLDEQLRQIALSVGDVPSAAGESSRLISGADPDDRIIVHILDNDMKTIRNSDTTIAIPVETVTGFYDHVDAGVQWRTFTLIAENRVVQVSQETEPRTAAAFNSMLNTVLPIALLIPFSWILVGWLVKRLLRPLQILAAALLARQAGSNVKLSAEGIPGEVAPVVDAMNDVLIRQHELLEFRQRFISDAAHQLRTPLTALTLQMENLKKSVGDKTEATQLRPIEQGFVRMSTLLKQLLELARAEEPQSPRADGVAELGDVVRASLVDVYQSAARKHIDLGLSADAQVNVKGDRLDLIMLLGNLLDNAIRYTPAHGKVDVDILLRENEADVTVTDTGPGIPEAALPLVFNRFYRHNPNASEGSGLGLPIVLALATRNGAEVNLRNREDANGLVASVTFKRAK
jgi:two-component system, OmpR family, sensor kinase